MTTDPFLRRLERQRELAAGGVTVVIALGLPCGRHLVRSPLTLSRTRLSVMGRRLVPHVAVAALAMMLASSAAGQTVATNFEELRLKVKAGDTVYITQGGDHTEQEAQILEVAGSTLAVSINGARRDVVESTVTRIRQRRPDSRKNGALIGLVVGGAGTTTGAIAMASPSGSCTGSCVAVNVLYGGGLGAVVGFGIDALIQGRRDLYVKTSNQASLGIGVQPLVSSTAKGLSVSFAF